MSKTSRQALIYWLICAAMEDLVLQAEALSARLENLPAAVVTPCSVVRLLPTGEFETLNMDEGRDALLAFPHLIVGRSVAARRLGLMGLAAYDLLELFAFVRPARFCLPTLSGLLEALALGAAPNDIVEQCEILPEVAGRLLADLSSDTYRYRGGARMVAEFMARAGWGWSAFVMAALSNSPHRDDEDGLQPWTSLLEWEDDGPPPRSGDASVSPDDSLSRLRQLLGQGSEDRLGQQEYSRAATHAFRPREMADMPNMQILEAGTGTGKTLGYIAPASLWAEKNGAPVWLSTYTKNLQRQLDQELNRLYPDPRVKAKRAVVRKGRENYACLLNIEETLRAVRARSAVQSGEDRDQLLMGLVARWTRYSRDGDMVGGDFPSWLASAFGLGRISGLTDRRGECLHAGCAHYRKCFIERSVRASKHADLVIANHALVMSQAALRRGDPDLPKRLVFDEGHHVFDAADGSFALRLSGLEGAELRRWLLGKESGGTTRARGLNARLEELIAGDEEATNLLSETVHAARLLPSEGWLGRVSGAAAMSEFEKFLLHVRSHVLARSDAEGPYGLEATLDELSEDMLAAAKALDEKLDTLVQPMRKLSQRLVALLDEEAETLESSSRGRMESAARSLALRADMVLGWRGMLAALDGDTPKYFVDWAELDRVDARERDVALARHFIDPTKPLADIVLKEAHGVVITSATLRDRGSVFAKSDSESKGPDWKAADMRTGAQHLIGAPRHLAVESPFDYASNSQFIVVNDVNREDARQVAGAFRALFEASGGGALGLFTAVSRLRRIYEMITPGMEAAEIPLLAQHVDPIDVSTLIDIFRADRHSCLLGTDAVRDGVDVPGDSMRLIVFDRVPWPRPTLLHRARREAFGGKFYDDMQTRLKLTQAFGRLIRRAGDRGSFVMLDGRAPTRLLAGLPDGVTVERMGLKDAIARVREGPKATKL